MSSSRSGLTKAATLAEVPAQRSHQQLNPKQYVYYVLFKPDGPIPSQQSVDTGNPYLGRIEAFNVAPPRSAETIIQRICLQERTLIGIHDAQLFLSTSSASPLEKTKQVDIMSGHGPGADPKEPLALVLGKDSVVYNEAVKVNDRYIYPRLIVDPSPDDNEGLALHGGQVLYTSGMVKLKGSNKFYRAMTVDGCVGFIQKDHVSKM